MVIDNIHLKSAGRPPPGGEMGAVPGGLSIPAEMSGSTNTSYKPIDPAYAAAETTTLTATVTSDQATHDFNLQ